jgi:riboflavin kinase / FMN adenylyltransferase
MKVVSGLSDAAANGPCVLTIGNFDGLHLGHQAILKAVVERARQLRICPAALTFDPHPVRVLAPDLAPKLISTLQQKLRLIESMGIELVVTVRFNAEFAALTPDAFIKQYLIDGLHTKALCVGGNFTFGNRQTGTVETLRRWQQEFELVQIPPVVARGVVVSSTHVRQRIQEGRVSRACRLLGRWFEIEGAIVGGAGRGRSVTVPTLNLEPDNELVPRQGVYITRTAMDSGNFVDSITNIGVRPTFDGNSQTIETFVLRDQVPETIQRARLQFLRRVRDEKRFDSPELLREQIGRDVQTARRFFRMLGAEANARIHSN